MSGKEISFLILGILCIVLSCCLLNYGEDMKFYRVLIGEEESSYYVMEDTNRIILEDVFSSNVHNKAYLDKNLLEVSLKNLKLNIQTFSCLETQEGREIDCKSFYTNKIEPKLKEEKIIPTKLEIKRNNQILYSGTYLEDLTSIIKEEGRYYFVVTYEQKVVRTIKNTKLLFSVKVVK